MREKSENMPESTVSASKQRDTRKRLKHTFNVSPLRSDHLKLRMEDVLVFLAFYTAHSERGWEDHWCLPPLPPGHL